MQSFSSIDLKSIKNLFLVVYLVVLLFMLALLFPLTKTSYEKLFLSVLIGMPIFLLVYVFSARIVITEFDVIKKSMFGKKVIPIQEIRSLQVGLLQGKSTTPLSKQAINKKQWFGQKMIYISTIENFDPNKFQKNQVKIIRTQYNEKLFQALFQLVK